MLVTQTAVHGASGPATDAEILEALRQHADVSRAQATFSAGQAVRLADRSDLPAELALRDLGIVVHDDSQLTTTIAVLHTTGTPMIVPVMTSRLAAIEEPVEEPAAALPQEPSLRVVEALEEENAHGR